MEITWSVISRERGGGKGTEKQQHKWWVENRQGRLRIVGNVEAKELICLTHGHELKRENAGGRGVSGRGE